MARANLLTGNTAANTLDGRGGADTMSGGDGADIYVVDDGADIIVETNATAAGGIDLVRSSVSFVLGANLDKLTLTGAGNIDGAGNGLNNTLLGNEGNNRLDGGAGGDAMTGGKGNDTYIVDSAEDIVTETVARMAASIRSKAPSPSASRPASTSRHLTLTGAAANATGNALGNMLTGNALGNILDGGTGADTLRGGAGNDLYILDKAGDVVDEQGNTDTGDEVKSASVLLRRDRRDRALHLYRIRPPGPLPEPRPTTASPVAAPRTTSTARTATTRSSAMPATTRSPAAAATTCWMAGRATTA